MSTDTFIALLLVSTFATVGIVTTLAARSQRHWFLRTAVVVVMLAPLLFVPAPELFATLLLEAATIAAGITLVEYARQRAVNVRFSLQTLVLVTVLVAGLLAIGRAMPELNPYAWQSLILMGVGSGLCVLLGLAGVANWPRWYLRLPLIVVASLLIGLVLAWHDWFVPSLQEETGWPPDVSGEYAWWIYETTHPVTVWLVVLPLIVAAVAAWFSFQMAVDQVARPAMIETDSATVVWARHAILVAMTLVLMIPPTVTLSHLLTPGETPSPQLPSPNAYDTIHNVGDAVYSSSFESVAYKYESIPTTTLKTAVSDIEDELETLRAALQVSSQVPVNFSGPDTWRFDPMNSSLLAYAMLAHGHLAQLEGNDEEACQSFLDAVRLGHSIRYGGLIGEALWGIHISEIGLWEIHLRRKSLPAAQCRAVIETLVDLQERAESVKEVNARDRAWERATLGWNGHLRQLVTDLSGDAAAAFNEYERTFEFEHAQTRLIVVELALQLYRLEHGTHPATLLGLVPDYIGQVPVDPFGKARASLRYSRIDGDYELYSLGPNRTDEGGTPPPDGETVFSAGDLILDHYFFDEEDANLVDGDETINAIESQ